MKNKLAYLGFLGIIGFGGFIFSKATLFSFFSFLIFFSYTNVIPDELFWENVKKSALHAFIVQTMISVAALAMGAVLPDTSIENAVMIAGLALNYSAGILIFALNIAYYESKEKRGKSE